MTDVSNQGQPQMGSGGASARRLAGPRATTVV